MHDVIVVGGSYAGISAALQLARARKSVLVVDAGERRNRFAEEAHGFLSRDGVPPGSIVQEAKSQLLAYPSVRWLEGRAVDAGGAVDAFTLAMEDGTVHQARRIVLALGVEDVLPSIPGLAGQWGAGAMGCPYCHGYELGGRPVAVIATGAASIHHATIVSDWGPTTLFSNDALSVAPDDAAELARRGIAVDHTPIASVEGGRGTPSLRLADGRLEPFAGLFVTASVKIASELPERLGCAFDDSPIGRLVRVDGQQATTVAGVFACGDAASAMASIALAVGSGAMAGAAVHRSMIYPEAMQRAA